MIGSVTTQAMASKKGAMRALGRVVRNDEAANEVVAAGGLLPIIALLECNDAGVVRRSCLPLVICHHLPDRLTEVESVCIQCMRSFLSRSRGSVHV